MPDLTAPTSRSETDHMTRSQQVALSPADEGSQLALSHSSETTETASKPVEASEPLPILPTATVPAVFGANANTLQDNIKDAEGLAEIAKEFIEQVKQGGWDTTSETYKKNWEQAAEEADHLVRARYGTSLFQRLKQEASP